MLRRDEKCMQVCSVKAERKRPPGRLGRRKEDNIKMYLK
jgi:hypothetical protein